MISHQQSRSVSRLGLVAVSVAPLTLLLAGCAKGPLCSGLSDCGGDPTGVWVSNSDVPGCIDGPYFTPTTVTAPGAPLDNSLFGRPAQVANTPLPQATLTSWCQGLILQKDLTNLVKSRTFVFQDPIISGLSINFKTDLTYEAGFVRSGRFSQYYSQTCITEYGQNVNDCPTVQATLRQEGAASGYANAACTPASGGGCDCSSDAGAHLSGEALTCQMVGVVLNSKAVDETFKNIACAPSAERGGCDCGFDVGFPSGEVGVYEVSGNIITTHPQNNSTNVPSKMTFCASGSNLDVSGYENSYLFDKAPVRTFHLTRYVAPPNP